MKNKFRDKYFIELKNTEFEKKIKEFFYHYEKKDIYDHVVEVVDKARILSGYFDINGKKSVTAAYLHDIGLVIEKNEIIDFCECFGEKVLEKETKHPDILHQKASKILAKNLFKIKDKKILSAISTHTTMKPKASDIDIVVFLSDKLTWKEEDSKDLIKKMKENLKISKEKAVLIFLENLYNNRENFACYHDLSKEAYFYFKNIENKK